MKTKIWILILALVLLVCAGLSAWLLRPTDAAAVEVWSEGKRIKTVSLSVDQTFAVETEKGVNVITVQNGKVAVTEADCPDKYCMARGFCSGGTQIVCLPNRLVLKFTGKTAVDGVTG